MVTGKCTAQVVDNSWGENSELGPLLIMESTKFSQGNSYSNLMTMKLKR